MAESIDDVLRPLSDEEYEKVIPPTPQEIYDALEKGRRERKEAERYLLRGAPMSNLFYR